MKNKVLKLGGGERSLQEEYAEIKRGNSERWTIRSQKNKYVNGKLSGVIGVGYTVSIDSADYILEEDKSDNTIQITAQSDDTSGLCIFTQNESGNKINLHLTTPADIHVTYTGYIKIVSKTLPLGSNRGNTAQIIVMAYLKGSDGSKKPETPHVGSSPDWCAVSVAPADTPDLENHYKISLIALSSNQTGSNRSGDIFLTCGDANLSIQVTQEPSTFTLSGLPINKGYFLFGKGAIPQNTSSLSSYLEGLSVTSTITMTIPFYANDSKPGSRIKCTTGDTVSVYTKADDRWVFEGSFTVPSGGKTVSVIKP